MFFGDLLLMLPIRLPSKSVRLFNNFQEIFFMAIRPPLIKSYAEGNYVDMMQLFYLSSRFSFFIVVRRYITIDIGG